MTLILTAINAACVVQASDRLTTTWRSQRFLGEHDPIANKTVIYLATDGPMVISFSGTAYVGDEPTDNWIARKLAGGTLSRMPDGRTAAFSAQRLPTRTFNEACWLLQEAIDVEAAFKAPHWLEVAIGGWRIRRGRLVQTLLAIVKAKNGSLRHGHMRLRTADFGSAFCSIGVPLGPADVKAARAAHPDQEGLLIDPATRSAFLAELIVQTSRSNPKAVGPDVMSVEIPRWQPDGLRRITIRFRPEVERYAALVGGASPISFPAAFWPWIVTPMGIRAPTVSTGNAMVPHFCGWEFVHEAPAATPPRGLLFAESSIPRPKPPR